MNRFRLIVDPPQSSAVNMAKDHAILQSLSMSDSLPALRLYSWDHASVTIGYFQEIEKYVNTDYCRKNGISITRRDTAGGTVLHHMELTYSFTLSLNNGIVPVSVEDSFRSIISPLINSINSFTINAEYRPVNDIVVNNRKISGSAQVRKRGILQQHGTLILDIDRSIISSAIRMDEAKLKKRGFSSGAESVTSIRDETGIEINEDFIEKLRMIIIEKFSKSFNINFSDRGLSDTEIEIMELSRKKYASDDWNLKR